MRSIMKNLYQDVNVLAAATKLAKFTMMTNATE